MSTIKSTMNLLDARIRGVIHFRVAIQQYSPRTKTAEVSIEVAQPGSSALLPSDKS